MGIFDDIGKAFDSAKNAVTTAANNAAKSFVRAQTTTKTAVKEATKNALKPVQNAGKSVSQNIADIARGKTTTSANGTWSIAAATGAASGALGGIASGSKSSTGKNIPNYADYIKQNFNTSKKGESNAADAIKTDIAVQTWKPVYVSNSKDGSKNTQTWLNVKTGDMTGFAGISAAGLSKYYTEKGDTANANKYEEIARASNAYSNLNTAGYRYDNMNSLYVKPGNVLGSSSFSGTPYRTAVTPTASTPKESTGVLKTASNVINTALGDVRADAYSNAGAQLAKGNIASPAVAAGAATFVADTVAPLDLINVGNKIIRGETGDLTASDYAFAALDGVALVAGALTGGLGYVGLKGAKTLAKGVKTASYATQAGAVGIAAGSAIFG